MALWIILSGFVLAIGIVVVGTWVGSARAAYIRAYNRAHGVHLPAGFVEELWEQTGWLNAMTVDWMRANWSWANDWAQRSRIWTAMRERQADPTLERLRVRAWRRTIVTWVLGTAVVVFLTVLLITHP